MSDWNCELDGTQEWQREYSPERDVTTAKEYAEQAKTYKNAAAEYAETAQIESTRVELAVDTAESEIESAKDTAVAAVSSASSGGVSSVESAASSGVSAINSAKVTAVSAVQSEGTSAVDAVDAEKSTALSAISSAASDQVSAVESAGSAQIAAVESAGDAKISAIQAAGISVDDAVAEAQAASTEAQSAATTATTALTNASATLESIRTDGAAYVSAISSGGSSALSSVQNAASTAISTVESAVAGVESEIATYKNDAVAAVVAAGATATEAASSASASAATASAAATQTETAVATHDASIESHADIRAALTIESETRADAVTTLNSGYASLLADLNSEKKKVKILQRTVENLRALLKDTDYKDVTDRRELHSKTLGDAEVCGDDVQVLPNGELVSIGGRTVVWNQLLENGNFESGSGWYSGGSINSYSNNECEISPYGNYARVYKSFHFVKNHKYIISADIKKTSNIKVFAIMVVISNDSFATAYTSSNETEAVGAYKRYYLSVTPSEDKDAFIYINDSQTWDTEGVFAKRWVRNVQVTDLTQLGMPDLTSDAFEALIDTTKYHPYNAGTLMSLPTKSVQIDGKNLFDRSNPESGYYFDDGFHIANADLSGWVNYKIPVLGDTDYRAKCFSGSNHGGTYCAYLDANKDFISQAGLNYFNDTGYSTKSYHTPVNCRYIAFCGFTSDVYEMSLVKGTSYPTTYTPKCRLTLVIPQSVKALAGYGVEGNVLDLDAKTFTQNRKKIVFDGSESWSQNMVGENTYRFHLYPTTIKNNANGVSKDIKWVTSGVSADEELCGVVSDMVFFRISKEKLSEYSTSAFKSYLSSHPVTVIVELKEPIVTDISNLLADFDNLLPGLETGGTVTFVSDGVAPDGTTVLTSDEQSLPVQNTIAYQTKIAS